MNHSFYWERYKDQKIIRQYTKGHDRGRKPQKSCVNASGHALSPHGSYAPWLLHILCSISSVSSPMNRADLNSKMDIAEVICAIYRAGPTSVFVLNSLSLEASNPVVRILNHPWKKVPCEELIPPINSYSPLAHFVAGSSGCCLHFPCEISWWLVIPGHTWAKLNLANCSQISASQK